MDNLRKNSSSKLIARIMNDTPLPEGYEDAFELGRVAQTTSRLKIFGVLALVYCAVALFAPTVESRFTSALVPSLVFAITIIHLVLLVYRGGEKIALSTRRAICVSFVYCLCAVELLSIYAHSVATPYHTGYFVAIVLLATVPGVRPRAFVPPAVAMLILAVIIAIADGDSPYLTFTFVLHAVIVFFACLAIVTTLFARGKRAFCDDCELRRLNKDLTDKATHDELTKLYNRRAFEARLTDAINACRRTSKDLCVIMLDVDCFKAYNDEFGHIEGDKALFRVAECIRCSFQRATDFCARFGGEEFVVIAEMAKADAVGAANTLLHRVASMNLPNPHSSAAPYLTISAGLVSLAPTENDTRESILTAADEALYRAKEAGRNRVVTK